VVAILKHQKKKVMETKQRLSFLMNNENEHKNHFFFPRQNDSLFWCFYVMKNDIVNYECHLINDKDVENGVVHYNQMNNMDIICIGTHGKGSLFHQSATEKLINHLFKPIISFHLN
jgi:hypothetical protein